jgi:two-component system response regulator (stage 0 sporulation protein A)
MKSEISVLIADDNIEFGDLLKEYMDQVDDIRVIGVCQGWASDSGLIVSHKPEVVILDVIMPILTYGV